MKKYSVKTIIDYISGNDIENFTLEELEDDMEFMKSVINYTNDKNMLFMCSERLQNDFRFIKYILYKFSYDLEFICKIADEFLAKTDEEHKTDRYEIAIIMCQLINNKDIEYLRYHAIASIGFLWELEFVKKCQQQYKSQNSTMGMGFIFIINDEENSPIMIEYFAKKFINHILAYCEINFEDLLHKRFSTKKELEQEKINSFLISFLLCYDIALANYAKAHLEILDGLKEEIQYAIKNWDRYIDKKEREIYDLLLEKVHQYMQENPGALFLEDDLLYTIGQELGVLDKIQKYNIAWDEDTTGEAINKKDLSFQDKIHYYAIKQLMTNILNGSYVEEDSYIAEESPTGKNVISIDFNKVQKKG